MADPSATSDQGPTPAPTRQAALVAWAQQMIQRTGSSERDFALRVGEQYRATVPPDQQSLPWPDPDQAESADEYSRLVDSARKRVERYLRGDNALPVELEEAWVSALGGEWSTGCRRELARRMGLLGARLPEEGAEATVTDAGALLRTAGAAVEALAPIVADGVVDEHDRPHVGRALSQIANAQAELTTWIQRLSAVLDDEETVHLYAVEGGRDAG
ncbi:hypothetical protein SAMN05660831_02075 [Thiohalospira halophila DSM 15071]|uniref:Uncharacterized protein n=1 Tax=Thiohalospira halophila DSM 15071 TaxID=1123397 RepID=A0A1I1U9U1_9GAMM|nr:hypothetical protein [Thiohalospira halophila]SFD67405.1 hypothetical protein SAMN05660831_02075 [Thiohalospira halophila DSM 15071]